MVIRELLRCGRKICPWWGGGRQIQAARPDFLKKKVTSTRLVAIGKSTACTASFVCSGEVQVDRREFGQTVKEFGDLLPDEQHLNIKVNIEQR
jgi:hypothetical protein